MKFENVIHDIWTKFKTRLRGFGVMFFSQIIFCIVLCISVYFVFTKYVQTSSAASSGGILHQFTINGNTPNGPSITGTKYGYSMTNVGDIDGDGVSDIVVSDPSVNQSRGYIYTHFFNRVYSSNLLKQTVVSSVWSMANLNPGDNYGVSITSLGDLDGDGVPEIAVGANYRDVLGVNSNDGRVYIHFLNSDGSFKSTTQIDRNTPNGPGSLGTNAQYGRALLNIGDLDGDGVPELAVGADRQYSGVGAIYIHFLNSDGSVKSTTEINHILYPEITSAVYYGTAISKLGDLDGDGVTEIVVGRYNGPSIVHFLNSDGSVKSSVFDSKYGGISFLDYLGDFYGNYRTYFSHPDGVVDILATLTAGDTRILSFNSFGQMVSNRPHVGGGIKSAMSMGDLNSDGSIDVITGYSGATGLIIFLSYPMQESPILNDFVGTPENTSVTLSSVVNDFDNDRVSIRYAYEAGECGEYSNQATSTIVSATDNFGNLTIAENQVTSVSTTLADNTVHAVWDISTDALTPNSQYCVYAFATDDFGNTSEVVTTTFYTNPAPPTNVSAIANGQASAIVSWKTNGNPTSTLYEVSNDFCESLNKTTTSTRVVVGGLSSGTGYAFKVRALSFAGSNQDSVYTNFTSSITTVIPDRSTALTLLVDQDPVVFSFAGSRDSHTVEVDSIEDANGVLTANLTFHSTVVSVSLGEGESQNMDLSGNGRTDTKVTIHTISNEEVRLTLSAISHGGSMVITNPPVVQNPEVKAVTINNGDPTTDSQTVRLTFNIKGAKAMSLSHDATFTDCFFSEYVSSTDWLLTPGNGVKVVHVRFRSEDGGMVTYLGTIELVGQDFDDPKETIPTQVDTKCLLLEGLPYKTSTDSSVYYITDDCKRRAFRNPVNYFMYFSSWNDVKITTEDILESIPMGDKFFMTVEKADVLQENHLVKTLSSPKVYSIQDNKKRWIVSEQVFNKYNYVWFNILDVDSTVLDTYPDGPDIE